MASTFFFGNVAFSINKIVLVSPQILRQYFYVSSVSYIWIKHLSNCIPLRLLCGPDECYFICFSGMMKTNVFFWVMELIDKITSELKSTSNRILPERVTVVHSVITRSNNIASKTVMSILCPICLLWRVSVLIKTN